MLQRWNDVESDDNAEDKLNGISDIYKGMFTGTKPDEDDVGGLYIGKLNRGALMSSTRS